MHHIGNKGRHVISLLSVRQNNHKNVVSVVKLADGNSECLSWSGFIHVCSQTFASKKESYMSVGKWYIPHECEVRVDKSVERVTVGHHKVAESCQTVTTVGLLELLRVCWQNRQSYPEGHKLASRGSAEGQSILLDSFGRRCFNEFIVTLKYSAFRPAILKKI